MKRERAIMENLKEELVNNNAVITKADKGNSIVTTYQEAYHDKVLRFINDNNFTTMNNNPTKTFQKEIRKIINEYLLIYLLTYSMEQSPS
jgi:hypothetical protein